MTSSGRRAHVLAPEETEIEIEDIAHALSMLCRFGGHCQRFYSVAQHSVLVSELVPARMALQALLHDAPEAYLGDVIRPLKRELERYKQIEEAWWLAIARRFDGPEEQPPNIKRADLIALMTERRDLLLPHTWQPKEDAFGPIVADERRIVPLEPAAARELFLARFRGLGGDRGRSELERLRELIAELEQAPAARELERLRGQLAKLAPAPAGAVVSWCPQCGPEPACDEDGCCQQCGADTGEVPDWRSLKLRIDELEQQTLASRRAVAELADEARALLEAAGRSESVDADRVRRFTRACIELGPLGRPALAVLDGGKFTSARLVELAGHVLDANP